MIIREIEDIYKHIKILGMVLYTYPLDQWLNGALGERQSRYEVLVCLLRLVYAIAGTVMMNPPVGIIRACNRDAVAGEGRRRILQRWKTRRSGSGQEAKQSLGAATIQYPGGGRSIKLSRHMSVCSRFDLIFLLWRKSR